MATIAHANSITRVSTSAEFPLGYEVEVPATSESSSAYTDMVPRVWVYVFNDNGVTAFAAGHIIRRDLGTATYDGVPTAAAALVANIALLGVAQHAIAGGSYGFILKKGIGEVMAGNGAVIGINTALTSAGTTTPGTALDFAAGTTSPSCVFAMSTEASTGLNGLATCWINCGG